MIAVNDLARHHAPLRKELDAAIARVLARGWYILGPEVEAFEQAFADRCGAAACVAVGNGTDALELALRALAIGAGDEVATVANAGMYASIAIRATGATPVYVEIDERTLSIDPCIRRVCHAADPCRYRRASLWAARVGRGAGKDRAASAGSR